MRTSTLAILGLVFGFCVGCTPPQPTPPPDPVIPTPVDPVNPVVPDVSGYRVLIIEETENRNELPQEQLAILTSATFRKWLSNNQISYRIWDEEVILEGEDPSWGKLLDLERNGSPWLIIVGKGGGFSGLLPTTLQETKDLIERYRP